MNVQLPLAAVAPALADRSAPASSSASHPQESFQQLLSRVSSEDKKLADTAKQFEAVIVGEVLKAARASSQGGWLSSGGSDDQTGELTQEIAEQGLAQGLAANGSLGIAKMVIANLRSHAPTGSSSVPSDR